jgi:hypothetical protein
MPAQANSPMGGAAFWIRVAVGDAATGDVLVSPLCCQVRVIDVVVLKTAAAGGAANTIQVKNGASPITDAISINIADQAIARPTTIDDAFHDILAGGTITVTRTKAGGNAACIVNLLCQRTA